MLSLTYFMLTSDISQFSGALLKNVRVLLILPRGEDLGVESQEE